MSRKTTKNVARLYPHQTHTYIFSEVELGLRVPISLTLHGDGVALFDGIGVGKGKGRFLRGIWMDKNRHGTGENSSFGYIYTSRPHVINQGCATHSRSDVLLPQYLLLLPELNGKTLLCLHLTVSLAEGQICHQWNGFRTIRLRADCWQCFIWHMCFFLKWKNY